LIAFAALAYTVSPLTTDYDWLAENLERIKLGIIKDGTAIGSAISSSLSRLKDSEAKSKVVILLTDGINNAGKIDPIKASQAAKAMGIKIYTIGAGSKGYVPFPARDIFGRHVYQNVRIELDEKTLKEIADTTGGQYFRAQDEESLRMIYKEIDNLEKTEIEKTGFKEYKQLFIGFLLIALLMIATEIILSNSLFMKMP
jgi:Ca-activated chloride channel family protein